MLSTLPRAAVWRSPPLPRVIQRAGRLLFYAVFTATCFGVVIGMARLVVLGLAAVYGDVAAYVPVE